MTPALVAFDLAGVVCRFDHDTRLARLARAAGLPERTVDERVWGRGLDAAGDRGELGAAEMRAELRAALGLTLADDALRALYVSAFTPDPDVLALVDLAAARTRVALLTNNGPLVLDALDHELAGVGRRFALRGFACRYRAVKPDPAIFRALAREADVEPASILFVDDDAGHVEAARALGLMAHHFAGPPGLRRALAGAGLCDAAGS